MSSNRLRSLRKAVWQDDKTGVGEALRDIHGFCSRLTLCGVTETSDVTWSEPFSFSVETKPSLVILADAREKGTSGSTLLSALDWNVVVESGAYRVKINRATALAVGRRYDLRFLVVY